MLPFISKGRFGYTLVTAASTIRENAADTEIIRWLERHCTADWGLVDSATKLANERALDRRGTVTSIFAMKDGRHVRLSTDIEQGKAEFTLEPSGTPTQPKT